MSEDLQNIIKDEKIMWEGKPDKKTFLFEAIFNPLMPFALLWAFIDFGILGVNLFVSEDKSMLYFLVPFFILHLMPVWLYLGGVLLSSFKYKNTYYIVTDKGVYASSGIINKKIQNKPFAELSHVDLHRGFFDQRFGVGDIICTSNTQTVGNNADIVNISSIREYPEVYNLIQKLQQDIYSDMMYPNDQRPSENHGYKTEYKG